MASMYSVLPSAVPLQWWLTALLFCLCITGVPHLPAAAAAEEAPSLSPAPRTSFHTSAITAQDVHESRTSASADAGGEAPPFVVFGYLPEYRQRDFPFDDVFAHGLTHLIFFSAEVDPASGALTHAADRLPQGEAWAAIRAAADAHGVRLMLCIGGGGRSAGFPALVADPFKRTHFVAQLNHFALEKGLDGVDINWEYPQSEAEWRNFAQLMREMKSSLGYVRVWDDVPVETSPPAADGSRSDPVRFTSRFPDHDVSAPGREAEQAAVLALWKSQQAQRDVFLEEKKLGKIRRHNHRVRVREMTLSMAVHPHPSITGLLDELNLLPWLDYLHWMAYDHVDGVQPHSSVEYAEFVLSDRFIGALAAPGTRGDPEKTKKSSANAQRALNALQASAGHRDHRRKLTLGIPFYGRHREDRRLEPETYERLQYFISQWAIKAHPTWLVNGASEELRALNEYTGYAFNSYKDVQAKMELARRTGPPEGIAGIMIWELGQDLRPPSSQPLALMRAVKEQLLRWNATRPPARSTVRVQAQARSSAAQVSDDPRKETVSEEEVPVTEECDDATAADL